MNWFQAARDGPNVTKGASPVGKLATNEVEVNVGTIPTKCVNKKVDESNRKENMDYF